MRTPAGFECPHFYGNYYRGRNQEECRLIGQMPPPGHWSADLCKKCPVPGILRANACQNLVLQAKVTSQFFGIRRRVQIKAFCKKENREVLEPEIGCGHCHEISDRLLEK